MSAFHSKLCYRGLSETLIVTSVTALHVSPNLRALIFPLNTRVLRLQKVILPYIERQSPEVFGTPMSPRSPIKACLFDVGGVCVLSPMLAIRDYEKRQGIPSGYINYAIISTSPDGAWHKLERGEIPMDSTFFIHFTADLTNPSIWKSFHAERGITPNGRPNVDGEYLFWEMMRTSRTFDPYIITAIRRLRETGKYKIGALTNDYQYPKDHPYSNNSELRSLFDVFVSSSESGMRKPEKGIYELALKRLGIEKPEEVVFLDDIGLNLKAARKVGLRTIRVGLEETWRAVRELEDLTGETLLPDGDPPIIAALGQDRAKL